jgi:hypothetical protein
VNGFRQVIAGFSGALAFALASVGVSTIRDGEARFGAWLIILALILTATTAFQMGAGERDE